MKKNFLIVALIGASTYATLTSSSSGYSTNVTGSKGTSAGCKTCHGSSAITGVQVAIELDSAGVPVTKYVAGQSYTIKLTGTNNTTSSLPKFGFELSTVKGSGSTATQAGSFNTLPANTHLLSTSGLSIFEQQQSLSPSSGTGAAGTVYSISVGWTAPVAGTGDITMYSVLNAVNANTTDDNGDKWNNTSVVFPEETMSSAVANTEVKNKIIAYPNPANDILKLQLGNSELGTYNVSIFSLDGKEIFKNTYNAAIENYELTISCSDWNVGLYYVLASADNSIETRLFIVKQ